MPLRGFLLKCITRALRSRIIVSVKRLDEAVWKGRGNKSFLHLIPLETSGKSICSSRFQSNIGIHVYELIQPEKGIFSKGKKILLLSKKGFASRFWNACKVENMSIFPETGDLLEVKESNLLLSVKLGLGKFISSDVRLPLMMKTAVFLCLAAKACRALSFAARAQYFLFCFLRSFISSFPLVIKQSKVQS